MSTALFILAYVAVGAIGVGAWFAISEGGINKWEYPFAALFTLLWPVYALFALVALPTLGVAKLITRLRGDQ